MAPIDDETLDRLLTRHLSSRLDGHLGRAEAAFRQRLADEGFDAGDPTRRTSDVAPLRLAGGDADDSVFTTVDALRPQDHPTSHTLELPSTPLPTIRPSTNFWQRPAGWITGVVTTAVAASLATLMLLPRVEPVTPTPVDGGPVASTQRVPSDNKPFTPTPDQPMVRYIYNQTWDEGTVTPGNTSQPIRRVRHQQVEHIRYYDTARGAWVELTVPKEDVRHYEMDTY